MASNKEIVVNSVNYGKPNGLNAINQKSRNKRLFTWKTVALICVINGKCSLDQFRIGFNHPAHFIHLAVCMCVDVVNFSPYIELLNRSDKYCRFCWYTTLSLLSFYISIASFVMLNNSCM